MSQPSRGSSEAGGVGVRRMPTVRGRIGAVGAGEEDASGSPDERVRKTPYRSMVNPVGSASLTTRGGRRVGPGAG
jgi:hypothetical protein